VEILNVNTEYGLHMSADIEKQMLRCRAPVRAAINQHLREIAAGAGKAKTKPKPKNKVLSRKEPPLRFYVYEGYRIVYHLDAPSRRVVVSNLELLSAA
jgi:hypothetical protein